MDRKYWVLIAIGTGAFMAALDGSVVNAILPVLRSTLHTDVALIEWVITVYLLVVSGLLLGFGRLGDLRGHKDIYLVGMVAFIASSAMCGLAPSASWLIAARALQAIGAAMQFANSPAILTKTFPASERGHALGLQATMTYLGLSAGPSLGGLLAEHLSWRWVFFINLPVGGLALFLCSRFIARDEPDASNPPFDLAGAVLFFSGLSSLLFALNQGHAWGWLSPATLGLATFAFALLAIFVQVERHRRSPMLDLSLFAVRAFSGSTASAVLNYVCLYGVLFLVPFYLIQGRGLSPSQAGLLLSVQPLVMMLAAPVSGAVSDRIGTRAPAAIGMGLLACGLWLLSRARLDTPLTQVALALAVCGLGTGIFIAPNNSALLGAAPKNRQGIASGVLATARNVGMVLGVGLMGAILTTVLHDSAGVDRAMAIGFTVVACLAAAGGAVAALR